MWYSTLENRSHIRILIIIAITLFAMAHTVWFCLLLKQYVVEVSCFWHLKFLVFRIAQFVPSYFAHTITTCLLNFTNTICYWMHDKRYCSEKKWSARLAS